MSANPVTVVYYPRPEGHLAPAELEAEFAKLGRNDPLWAALMQLIGQRLTNAMADAVLREENAPGRMEELIGLQRELAALRDRKVRTK